MAPNSSQRVSDSYISYFSSFLDEILDFSWIGQGSGSGFRSLYGKLHPIGWEILWVYGRKRLASKGRITKPEYQQRFNMAGTPKDGF